MKIFLLFFLFGLAAADFFRYSIPQVDEAIEIYLEGFGKTGTLRNILGLPEAVELDQVEEDVKKKVGDILREHLENLLKKIDDHIDKGLEVREEVKRVKELKEKLQYFKNDANDNTKKLLQNLTDKSKQKFRALLEKYKLAKQSLKYSSELVELSNFYEVLEKAKNKILETENIRKTRDYIGNFITKIPEVQNIKEYLLRLRDDDFREFLRAIFERRSHRNPRGIKESWEKVKEWFKDLKENIREKVEKLLDFLKENWNIDTDKLKSKADIIKALAEEFIKNHKAINSDLAERALKLFLPYKEVLGEVLWEEISAIINNKSLQ